MRKLARLRGVWHLALVSRGAKLGKLRPFWAIFDAGPVDFTICVLLVAIGGMRHRWRDAIEVTRAAHVFLHRRIAIRGIGDVVARIGTPVASATVVQRNAWIICEVSPRRRAPRLRSWRNTRETRLAQLCFDQPLRVA